MEYFLLEEDVRLPNKLKINFNKKEFNNKEPFVLNLKTEKWIGYNKLYKKIREMI